MLWRILLLPAVFAALPVFAQDPVRLPPAPPDSMAVRDSMARADSARAHAADTAGDTVSYSALRIRFSDDRFSLAGGALLKYKGSTLRADSIIYYSEDDVVDAFGAPVIEDPANPSIQGYRMRYNLKNRVGTLYYGSSEKDGQTFNGVEVRRQPDSDIYIARGDLSTCDAKPEQHYYFYARRMIIEPESKVLSGPIVMNIAEVPLAVLPMMVLPLGKGRRSGMVQPKFGGDQTQGYYLSGLGYYWAISDYQDFKATADIVEGERGTFDNTSVNALYNWNKRYVWSGSVNTQIFLPQFETSNAGGILDFSNDLNLTPDGRQTLKGNGRLQTSANIARDNALNEQQALEQTANATLGYHRQFDWNQASLNVTAKQDYNLTQEHIDRDLPDMTFSVGGPLVPESEDDEAPIGEDPWYRNWSWSYSNRFNVNQVIRSARNGTPGDSTTYAGYADQASLNGTYTAFDYINLKPSLNLYQLWSAGERSGDSARPYRSAFDPGNGKLGQYFIGGDVQVGAETHLYGLAQADDKPWFGRVSAVRHVISPSLSFIYAPELDSNTAFFGNPRIGGSAFQIERRTVGIGIANDVDLKLANRDSLAQKPAPYKLLSAASSTDYNFAAPVRPWSEINTNVSLYLTRSVAFQVNAVHDIYDPLSDSATANREKAPVLRSWSFAWRKGFEVAGGFNSGLRVRDTYGMPTDGFEQSPWSASLNYFFNFSANRVGNSSAGNPAERFFGTSEIYELSKSHQASASLRLNPTKEWKMSYDTDFNFTEGEFSRHSFGFERTLHCWQMIFHWNPVGVSPGWDFVIRIIDLPDVKLETRDTRNIR